MKTKRQQLEQKIRQLTEKQKRNLPDFFYYEPGEMGGKYIDDEDLAFKRFRCEEIARWRAGDPKLREKGILRWLDRAEEDAWFSPRIYRHFGMATDSEDEAKCRSRPLPRWLIVLGLLIAAVVGAVSMCLKIWSLQ